MSDGISEGYRAARASDRFENKWKEALAEIYLLDLKEDLSKKSIEKIYLRLMELCPTIEVKNYDVWEVQYNWGVAYQEWSNSDKWPKVRMYEVYTNGYGVHKTIKNKDFREALQDALIFNEWLITPEGKKAADDYKND